MARLRRHFYLGRRWHRNTGQIWQRLWALAVLELWLREHLDGAAQRPAPWETEVAA